MELDTQAAISHQLATRGDLFGNASRDNIEYNVWAWLWVWLCHRSIAGHRIDWGETKLKSGMASDGEDDGFTKKFVDVYRSCSLVPIASKAHISVGGSCNTAHGGDEEVEVQVTWIQKDIERNRKVASNKSYFVERTSGGNLQSLYASNFQTDSTNV